MKSKAIALLVTGFVVVHFCAGFFFFWADISSGNAVMAHYYQEVHGYPRDWMCITSDVLWFPAGPLSNLFWAVPFYGALRLIAWTIDRQQKVDHSTVSCETMVCHPHYWN